MIFNSLTYILFLFCVIPLYWVLPERAKLYLIFFAGVLFYGFWRFDFLGVLFFSIIFDYFSAITIEDAKSARTKKLFMFFSLTINLSLIAFFKYFYFLQDSVIGLGSIAGIKLHPFMINIVLPIGISFYTFHSMSYIIDVFRGHIKANRNFILFVDYVIFFPQLVAGPILRAGEMLWQLEKRPPFSWRDIEAGVARILAGMFLKVCLADNVAYYVNESYGIAAINLSAIDVLTLGFLFGMQIYFDFSGYSHIAIGTARLMGIRFPENFNYPYHSLSPRIFWRRWHVSLSSWIRDYVYLPLAGVEVRDRNSTGGIGIDGTGQTGTRNAMLALFSTWAIMGLWHGAAWTFVLWGVWHAALVAGHRMLAPYFSNAPPKLVGFLGWGITLCLVMIGWVPFRAPSMDYALTAWGHFLHPAQYFALNFRETTYIVAAVALAGTIAMPYASKSLETFRSRYPQSSLPVLLPASVIFMMLLFVYLRPLEQFIYFQF